MRQMAIGLFRGQSLELSSGLTRRVGYWPVGLKRGAELTVLWAVFLSGCLKSLWVVLSIGLLRWLKRDSTHAGRWDV